MPSTKECYSFQFVTIFSISFSWCITSCSVTFRFAYSLGGPFVSLTGDGFWKFHELMSYLPPLSYLNIINNLLHIPKCSVVYLV